MAAAGMTSLDLAVIGTASLDTVQTGTASLLMATKVIASLALVARGTDSLDLLAKETAIQGPTALEADTLRKTLRGRLKGRVAIQASRERTGRTMSRKVRSNSQAGALRSSSRSRQLLRSTKIRWPTVAAAKVRPGRTPWHCHNLSLPGTAARVHCSIGRYARCIIPMNEFPKLPRFNQMLLNEVPKALVVRTDCEKGAQSANEAVTRHKGVLCASYGAGEDLSAN